MSKFHRYVFWLPGLLPAGIGDERRRVAEAIVRIQEAAGLVDDAFHVGK